MHPYIKKRAETTTKKTSSVRFANNPTQTFTPKAASTTKTTKKTTTTKSTVKTSSSLHKTSSYPSNTTPLPSSSSSSSSSSSITSSFSSSSHTPTSLISSPLASSTQLIASQSIASSTPSVTSSLDTFDSSSSSISGGAIAGIVIAVLAVLAGAIAGLLISRRKKKQRALASPSDPFTVGFSNDHPPMQSQTHIPVSQYQPQLQPQLLPEGLGVFSVAATYTPTLSDEIDIQVGDQVQLLAEYDDGWCQGMNLTQNSKGVFPKHCLDYTNADSTVKRLSSMHN
ncbi:hypothetical protein G6F56_002824 [Rhizopus delemar]|nr:hypothetical protein G6F56_002824 [Rhizopus delemar]